MMSIVGDARIAGTCWCQGGSGGSGAEMWLLVHYLAGVTTTVCVWCLCL
jgi:hypothetical protein